MFLFLADEDSFRILERISDTSIHGNNRRVNEESNKFLGIKNGPTTLKRKPLLVGVVTEDHDLRRTVNDVTETWGQGSTNLLFYSLSSKLGGSGNGAAVKENGREGEWKDAEGEEWVWDLKHFTLRRRHKVQKGSMEEDGGEVVYLDYQACNLPLLVQAVLPVLTHMYNNLVHLFDWFVVVPNSTYIRIHDIEELLSVRDSSVHTLLRHTVRKVPRRKKNEGSLNGRGWSCDESLGFVLSRELLLAIGELLQGASQRSGGGGEGYDDGGLCFRENMTSLGCLARQVGVGCSRDYQVCVLES